MLDLRNFGKLGKLVEEQEEQCGTNELVKKPEIGERLDIRLVSINDITKDALCCSEEYKGIYFKLLGSELEPFMKNRPLIRLLDYTFVAIIDSIDGDEIKVSLAKGVLKEKHSELLAEIQENLDAGEKVFAYAKVLEKNYVVVERNGKKIRQPFLKLDIEGTGLIGTVMLRSWDYGYFSDEMLGEVPKGTIVPVKILGIVKNAQGYVYCRCSRKDEKIYPNLWKKGFYQEGSVVNGKCIVVEPRYNRFVIELLENRRMRVVCPLPSKNKKNLRINVGAVYTCIMTKIDVRYNRFEGEVF